MKLGNRIIYNQDGIIISQSGEIEGDVLPRPEISELHCIDIEYGDIDYGRFYIDSIDMTSGTPIIVERVRNESPEKKHIRELEDALLLQMDAEIGGIL